MNREVEPPERKKKRMKKTKTDLVPTLPPSSPSYSLLPDDITVSYLARISRSYYPLLSIVSKSFHSILSSRELYAARSHLGSTEECVYVYLWDKSYQFPQWFTLWTNPNQTLPDSSSIFNKKKKQKKKKKEASGQLLVPITSCDFPSMSESALVVGYEIYVIGGPVNDEPSSAVRILDCRTHTWRDAPSMNVARKNPFACLYDGKIYVSGGVEDNDKSWAEVFDTKTQTWEYLSYPSTDEIRESNIDSFGEFGGKIYIRVSEKLYAYDTVQCQWECCKNEMLFTMSECEMDNVMYRNVLMENGCCKVEWSKDGHWRHEELQYVKGLALLEDMYKRNGGSSTIGLNRLHTTILVSRGGKLLLIWEGYMNRNSKNMKKIWCAEIAIEYRDGGEVWGKVERLDVVHKVPSSCELFQGIVVSV